MWYREIDHFLISDLGFVICQSDPCLYILCKQSCLLLVSMYVDDLLISGRSTNYIKFMKTQVRLKFEMKYLGGASASLGLEIHRKRTTRHLHLAQPTYIVSLLARFGMAERKTSEKPLDSSLSSLAPASSPSLATDTSSSIGLPYPLYPHQHAPPPLSLRPCFPIGIVGVSKNGP